MINILKPDFVFEDDRGAINQLIHKGYNQVNVVYSNAGAARGGHYHKLNKEAFFIVSGSVRVSASRDGDSIEMIFNKGDMFEIEPGTAHDFCFLTDTVLVGMYDKGVELENGEKDIIKV